MKQSAVNFVSREHTSREQLNSLLNAFSMTSSFLLHARDLEENTPEGGKLDGGAKAAVEATVIGICTRLDALIADPSRWNMECQNDLESSLIAAYKQNVETGKQQAAAFADSQLPHHTFTPQFAKLTTGAWVAYYGDLADLDNAIVGVGETPEQAVRAFDGAF